MSFEELNSEIVVEKVDPSRLLDNGMPEGAGDDGEPRISDESGDELVIEEYEIEKIIEALIFVTPEPISEELLAEVTGLDAEVVRKAVADLMISYMERDCGIVIREVGEGFAMYAIPRATPYISRLIRSQVNPRLTRAALETLAIVAYLQPVSRGVVSDIRGVHSEGVIKTLEERELVKPVGKGPPPGYPMLYGTTRAFLERFGMKNIGELPDLDQFAPDDQTIERIRRTLSWETAENGRVTGPYQAGENTEDNGESGDSIPEDGGDFD